MWNEVKIIKSSDENVLKYVFEKNDAVAEAVLYKYPTYEERTVICCSTQSGCQIGCRFCGSGDNFVRTLTPEEIVSQPARLLQDTGVDPQKMKRLQIMFMSMGEPMMAWKSLKPALYSLYDMYPKAALLISTSGPDTKKWEDLRLVSQEIPTVGLQFSVHEAFDSDRNKLIPFEHKLTLEEIADEGVLWYQETGRQPFFNYCVHDKNNTEVHAKELARLFNPEIWQATISVICEREEHVAAANERQRSLAENFCSKLNDLGFSTRVFNPAGQDDIGGGCGMLWFVQEWMRNNPEKAKPSVGFGLPMVHTPR